jgi:flagellar hook-basal body complex protein FliE
MSLFDILEVDKEEQKKKPTVDELYGYEEEEEPENKNFLDRMLDDIKSKQQNARNQERQIR